MLLGESKYVHRVVGVVSFIGAVIETACGFWLAFCSNISSNVALRLSCSFLILMI